MSDFPLVIDLTNLDDTVGFMIQGDEGGDNAGFSVSWAGDVNGDGIDDFLVGSPFGDDGGTYAGEAYLIFGKASGFGTIDLTGLSPTDGFVIQGDEAGDFLGRDVSGAGDVNGDGIDDFIVGASNGDDGGDSAGEAYVIYGKTSGHGDIDLSSLTAADGFVIQGDAADDIVGNRVSAAGDVNGDGLDDLIVAGHGGSNGGTYAGEAYVVFGRTDGIARLDLSVLTPADGFIIQGAAPSDFAGRGVSGAGDINNDGFADLIVGASGNDDGGGSAGKAYVIFGKATGFGTVDLAALTDGFSIQGDVASDFLGLDVAGAGDINGDGFADIIVGALGSDDGGSGAGEAYVIFGKSTGFANIDITTLSPTNGFAIRGDADGDQAGFSVDGAGDINGDGFADLIVGARSGDDGGSGAGEAYVIFGRVSGLGTIDLGALTAEDGFIVQGDAAGDRAGFDVSAAGDVNGDGLDDLIVGAYKNDAGGTDAGAAYVIYGRAPSDAAVRFGSAVDQTIQGGDLDDYLFGMGGGDVLLGGAGNDVLLGDLEIDTLVLNRGGIVDQYAELDGFAAMPTGSLTLELFYRGEPGYSAAGPDIIFLSYAVAGPTGGSNEILIYGLPDGAADIQLWFNNVSFATGYATADLMDGNLHRMSVTYDIATDTLGLFIDGSEVYSSGAIGQNGVTAGGRLIIGQEQDSATGDFFASPNQILKGEIADIRIWDTVRTDTEIAQNAFTPIGDPADEAGLVANWQPDAGNGLQIADATGGTALTLKTVSGTGDLPVFFNTDGGLAGGSAGDLALDTLSLNANGTVDQYVELDGFAAMPASSSLTVELLYRAEAPLDPAGPDIVLMSYAVGGNDNEILIYGFADGILQVVINNTAFNTSVRTASVMDGAVHRVSVTVDIDTNLVSLLIDGVTVDSSSAVAQGGVAAGGRLIFGQEQDSSTGAFGANANQLLIGEIADIRVWNFARSEAEIAATAFTQIANPATETGLVANWRPDAADTNTIADAAGGAALQQKTVSGTGALAGYNEIRAAGDMLIGGLGNDVLVGGAGKDTLIGDSGGDILTGGAGDDTLDGGAGIDTASFASDTQGVTVTTNGATGAGIGTDTLTGIENLTGGAGNDQITGGAANNTLSGGSGDDTLSGLGGADILIGGLGNDTLNGGAGADTMAGGDGDDSYFVDDAGDFIVELDSGGGTDVVRSSVSYVLRANVDQLRLLGSDNIDAIGNTGDNLLIGNSGNNQLNGSTGIDTMQGGDGDDTYFVDNAGDVVVEGSGLGTDQVQSSISITLASNIENGLLLTSANLDLTGNAFGNTLFGNAGNNVLDGGAGVDVMAGGAGDDTYIVDLPSDFISEQAAAGTDSVQSTVNYSLRPNIENLTLLGTANLQGIGNAENNILIGNSGANRLNGSLGADTMTGGDGNDIYSVDDAGDVVTENANEGIDTILSFATQTLGANVERLYLFGTADIDATGNGDNNGLLGNDGDNALSGEAGNDLLFGGFGNDTMTGGAGNDSFFFHTALDGVNNVETLIDFSHADDTMRLDSAVFTGLSTGLLSANAFLIGTAAGDADDRIIYDDTTGDLFFDADGNGAAAQVQFATLDDIPTDVAFNDFLVI